MDFNSFTDPFAESADVQVHAEGDKDTKPEPPTRDEFFYFDTLVFQVETTLFRIPRHGFEVEGSFFQTVFSLPGSMENGEQAEGRDDKRPIVLEAIKKEHFRGFLRVMYPFDDVIPTYEEWVGALDLATMWDFAKIRDRSIEALSGLLNDKPTTDKILLGKKYHVKTWLVAGYTTLLTQDKLDFDQLSAASVDWPTISKLCYIRERVWKSRTTKSPSSHTCSYCRQYCQNATVSNTPLAAAEVQGHITQDFASELGDC